MKGLPEAGAPQGPVSLRRNTRLSSDDWAKAALEVIAEEGVSSLAVEPLARRLGVTKGSFYWHFPTRDALLDAALQLWETEEQAALAANLEKVSDSADRMRAMITLVSYERRFNIIYAQLLKASEHPIVGPVIQRATQRRLHYIEDGYLRAGLPGTEARYRAWLAYSAYIGFMQVNQLLQDAHMTSEQFSAYVEHVVQTLVPSLDEPTGRD